MPIHFLRDPVWAQRYTSAAVFLFFAISLVVRSGYSLGAALLFLGGLAMLCRPREWPILLRHDKALLALFLAFFLVWVAGILLDEPTLSKFDKPIRILCAAAALLWLLKHPPRREYLWGGIAAGAILVGAWAGWQKLELHVDRAQGYTHMIQFGNISMLLGMLSLAGLGWAWVLKRSLPWSILMLLAFFCGLGGSLFSGSRGGWIGIPFVLMVIVHAYKDHFPRKAIMAFVLATAAGIALLYYWPATGVQSRVQEAVSDVTRYVENDVATTSVGARLEMWRFGWLAFQESPLLGLGDKGLAEARQRMIAEGRVQPVVGKFNHLHSEYVDVAAKRGLLGLCALLLLYLIPLRIGTRLVRSPDAEAKPYAVAVSILCVSYMDYGLSQTFLSHNSGVMVFFFSMVIFWSLLPRSGRADVETAQGK
ncbi:O-antigen ligase family protein [Paracandidimonas soli]|uniref:O-antigen ligase n=1 Tax=Paracandidimonas soli TaxID=1917182 RepID=A0A4R3V730_9BURK|nr:O-antigen ligase family protein [Paracandidimonas soli]TCU99233.1 O-antigen ligase [Paracandidimonas soli]